MKLSDRAVGCWIVLLLPLVLLAAPFVLTFEAIKERLQRCHNCGRRGTLGRVSLVESPVSDTVRRRMSPDSVVWQCRACGARFRQDEKQTPINP